MGAEEVVEVAVEEVAESAAVELGGITASWLANELDRQGVVRLRNAVSDEWLDAMRRTVTDRIAEHGDGDLLITEPDRVIGSPAHQLMTDPGLRRLFAETTRLRLPSASATQKFQCHIPVRNGIAPKTRSNLFHYDASVLTLVVPIYIPHATVGSCGELAAFGNKRPFRRFVATHFVDTILTHNSVYRRHLVRKIAKDPERYLVDLEPGNAYVFWGYRQFHGNLECAPGLRRATLVVVFGDVHSDSRALKVAWRFSRSRRDLGRFAQSPPTLPEPASDSADRLTA